MLLTPRQIAAYLEFSEQIDRDERADELYLGAVAAQGDAKMIESTLKALNGT